MENWNILVCGSLQDRLEDHDLQIVSKAREIANKMEGKVFFQKFNLTSEEKDCLSQYGVDCIYTTDSEGFLSIRSRADVIEAVIKATGAKTLFIPATDTMVSVASILATRLASGLTAECVNIDLDEEGFIFERAALNQSVLAKIRSIDSEIDFCTIKKDAFLSVPLDLAIETEVQRLNPPHKLTSLDLTKLMEKEKIEDLDLNKYQVICCIGRGVRSKDTRLAIERIAHKLGGLVCGTRAVVEKEWITEDRQLGQSGKSAHPSLYIGFGVSGASQHMVGLRNAKKIVAVNKDPKAPIFQYASCSFVEDVDKFVEKFQDYLEVSK